MQLMYWRIRKQPTAAKKRNNQRCAVIQVKIESEQSDHAHSNGIIMVANSMMNKPSCRGIAFRKA
jgi:hypothetical protein